MKKFSILFLFLTMVLTGCTEKYGQPADTGLPEINVMKALTDQSLKGREVNIEGSILIECGSGCWFFLKDNTGHILIDLAPNNFTIPNRVGKKARVSGTLTGDSGEPKIIAKSVEIS